MRRVLIFGVCGFVGSYLVQEFLNNGYEVYGSDKIQGKMLSTDVRFIISDLMNEEDIEKIIKEVVPDIIVNLAAVSSVGASWNIPQTTMLVNVIGALNIMEAVKKNENKTKIMFIGSSEEYIISESPIGEDKILDANNPYGISKVTQEMFAKLYREQYGLKIYYVRTFNHTGGRTKRLICSSKFL